MSPSPEQLLGGGEDRQRWAVDFRNRSDGVEHRTRLAPDASIDARTGVDRIEPRPEPLEWRMPAPLQQRITRAVSAPILAAVVVFVVVVLVSVAIVWAQPHAPAPDPASTSASASVSEQGATGAASGLLSGAVSGQADDGRQNNPLPSLFVHVAGEVRRPGVVELEAGSRVGAAIEAAGGPTDEAKLDGVNLARILIDGEQILVPNEEQAAVPFVGGAAANGGAMGAGTGLVNLNSADSAALETLPQVGPALAQRIISWRESSGGFTSVDQLLEVSGIGVKTLERLRALVTV